VNLLVSELYTTNELKNVTATSDNNGNWRGMFWRSVLIL